MGAAKVLPVCLALLLAAAGAADESSWRLTGAFENDTAYRLYRPHGVQKSQTRLELDLEGELARSLRLRARGRLLWDPRRLLVPGDTLAEPPSGVWRVSGHANLEAELRELYLDWRPRVAGVPVDLRIGKQQIVWGQSLGLRILDTVNPQDFREFVLDDFVDSRIPLWGVRADTFLAGWSLQGFAFPHFEPHALADPSGEFAFDPALPGFLPALAEVDAAPPFVPEAFPLVISDGERRPKDWRLSETTWGLQIGRHWHGFDLTLNYLEGHDPETAYRRRIEIRRVPVRFTLPSGAEVELPVMVPVNRLRADHLRVRTLGGSFATSRGAFAYWGETTLTFGRAFAVGDLEDSDGIVRRPDLRYALGIDWVANEHVFANVQWIQRVVLGHDSRLEVERTSEFLSLLVRLDLRRATLFPQLFTLYGLDHGDMMVRPSLEWRVSDRLSLTLGADVFTGGRRGLLGQFANRRDCVPIPEAAQVPEAGRCLIDPPPGRPSRAFVRVRWAFELPR